MKYYVTVGAQELVVEVDGARITVDGEPFEAHLSAVPGTPLRHLLLGERSYTLPFEARGSGRWGVGFQGEAWEVEVVDERTRHIRSLTGDGRARRDGAVLTAPMPGLVVKVDVTAGQSLPAGAGVVILEAMKMQNELRTVSPVTVKAVRVNPGQAVEKGQVLVEFEGEK